MHDRKARTNEAFDLLKQGREAEARAILERIVAGDDADAAVLETLGDVREKLGDKSGAMDAYAGAVTHLRARGDPRRALGVVELMQLVDDQALPPRREAAELRLELGDAVGCWREVSLGAEAALSQHNVDFVMELCADFAHVLPDAAPALHIARRMEHVDRTACVTVCSDLGDALRTRGKSDDALALYACALDVEPANRSLLHARAGALLETGRFAEARVVVERALALDPNDLVGIGLLERVAQSMGDDAGVRAARDRFDRVAQNLDERAEDAPSPIVSTGLIDPGDGEP